jgi:L-iditol 2-dehydrogenase
VGDTQRVAVYYNNRDVRIEERPMPKIGPGELLMRVEACGICGSDVLEWYRIKKAPLVLGHELAGVVESVGEAVTRYRVGDRIAVAHHVPCNSCYYCLSGHPTMCETLLHHTNIDPGGFAEYCRVPAINVDRGVFRLPDHLSFEDATLAEPLGCVLRGQRIAGLKAGQSVLVLGSGLAGLLHVMAARAQGAGFIAATDVQQYRLDAARRFGADLAIHAREDVPDRLKEKLGRLADLVIVSTGAQAAVAQALASVERGGTVLFFASTDPGVATPLSINDFFWRRDTTLTTTYAAAPEDYQLALDLIAAGRVPAGSMITHRVNMANAARGFQIAASGQDCMKVVVLPHA